MSTIRSRRRWIRLQFVAVTCLTIVVLFPSSPRTLVRAVAKTPVYQKVAAIVEESYVRHKIQNGDADMEFMLAYLYYSDRGSDKYIVGDPASLLQAKIDDGNLQAIRALAFMYRKTDPEKAGQLTLRAADMGDYSSQVFYMRDAGYEMADPEPYVQKLFELQKDRPGWKISFNRIYRTLQDQAKLGNEDAAKLLEILAEQSSEFDV